jgi:hypothetical protein
MARKDASELINKLPDGCWLPMRNKVVKVGERKVSLRRYVWAAEYGVAPEGMEVRPSCGRKMCVRPSHCDLHPSSRAERLELIRQETRREVTGPVVVGDEVVPARLYREIKEHPPASLAVLRGKFGLSSSTIYKIRAGLVEEEKVA